MGLRQVGFRLVVILAFGLSAAQWQGSSTHNQYPLTLGPRAFAQVPQVPQSYDPRNPGFAPQRFGVQTPARSDFARPSQDLFGVQSKELMMGPVAKLTWSFPRLPEEPQQPDIPFELRHPVPANSVAAQCGESSIYVEVMEDFFGTGKPLMPTAFSLGGCAPTGEDPSSQVLIFESELHGCGSTSLMTEDELVYTFSLIYAPQQASLSGPIIRSSGAVVGIECHYARVHDVSSDALMPTWIPYAATIVSEELLLFSLRLMTDDWRFERPSNQYYLGDFINIEASVRSYNHVPLRVFVDSCVATSVPDTNAIPRYAFIENNGCLVDAKLTASSSRFMPRTQIDKLQFQLEAFRFQQEISGFVYITCVLKVAAASTPTNFEQKACSFSANRWLSADEDDQVCGCCDATCGVRSGSDQLLKDLRWDRASVGPIRVKEYGFGPM
ncbi:hypothetical protein Q8A67_000700 [Cirrhinus molitorella]|uniref:Zona pellucida sperm-binding protein 3 n=1 Tax=Cirrhinus molitorella TaxID=172907 RepID=A0AA88QA68_9TELE|nr:hypothetical protein Q8A67_000700 [Cirrhinus molitorella]